MLEVTHRFRELYPGGKSQLLVCNFISFILECISYHLPMCNKGHQQAQGFHHSMDGCILAVSVLDLGTLVWVCEFWFNLDTGHFWELLSLR